MKVKDETAYLWTLPNRLSLIRILFIPVIIVFISTQEEGFILASCLLFIIAGITDGLDGFMARKLNMTSRLGLYLDPVADKLLVSSVLIALSYYRMVPLWVTIILIVREFLINGLRSFYAMEGTTIYPSIFGKLKTALQIIGISFILFFFSFPHTGIFHRTGIMAGMFILYGALFFSIFSATQYIVGVFKSKG
jgi:CDP-diacylglycerol--glycerol-3-phosphate 3-phosphatidyltransferase